MAFDIFLSIGESFADVRGYRENSPAPIFQARWYLPRKSLSEGIKEILSQIEARETQSPGRIIAESSVVQRALSKRQGQAPAVLVNTGFESFLKSHAPLNSQGFSPNPGRSSPILQSALQTDLVFGLTCRTSADGKVAIPLDIQELEFIAAKLEMMKIKSVALALLHAREFPELEKQAEAFLSERGFHVTSSHTIASTTENSTKDNITDLWSDTVQAAYAYPVIEAEQKQLNEGIGELSSLWSIQYKTSRDSFKKRKVSKPTLHLGVEEFWFLSEKTGAKPIGVNPTQLVTQSSWPFPTYSENLVGFEPGPMCFGKSQQLCLLDVLFAREKLSDVDGVTPLISDRTKPRILESVLALGKSARGNESRTPIDAKEVAADLEQSCIERLAISLSLAFDGKALSLTGAMAESFLPLLKRRRPDLDFTLAQDHAWFELNSLRENSQA